MKSLKIVLRPINSRKLSHCVLITKGKQQMPYSNPMQSIFIGLVYRSRTIYVYKHLQNVNTPAASSQNVRTYLYLQYVMILQYHDNIVRYLFASAYYLAWNELSAGLLFSSIFFNSYPVVLEEQEAQLCLLLNRGLFWRAHGLCIN